MCELRKVSPLDLVLPKPLYQIPVAGHGTFVAPADLAISREQLAGTSDQGAHLQCLEPEGWQDVPWPAEGERLAVPQGTKLRARMLLRGPPPS